MSSAVPTTQPIDYAPPDSAAWRRRMRGRVSVFLLLATLATLGYLGFRFGPGLWKKAQAAYVIRQCRTFTAPAGLEAYSENAAAMLERTWLRGGAGPVSIRLPMSLARPPGNDPPCVTRLGGLLGPAGASTLRTTSHYPLLFLHERTSAAGKQYIVVVRRRPRGEWELLNGRLYTPYFYMMIEPGSRGATLNSLWGARKSEPTFGPAAQSLAAKTASQEAPSPQGHMRLFMGYRDPKDPSLFFLPYEIDGVPGRVKVRLTDRGTAIDLSFNEP